MKAVQRTITIYLLTTMLALAAGIALAQAPTQGGQSAPQQPAISPSVWAAPPATQAQASSAFQSACGNQPLCYDTPNFAAAVVDFRMSMNRGAKVMDATVRFVNKSNQPLILGYVDNSAVGLDDQGNRYGTYYNTGLAGIGIVSGNNADPKFMLQPGGAGDARFELMWRPGAQDPIGSVFEVGLTIREVNTLPGGQHTLGGEYPLRFQGLANGVTGASAAAAGTAGAPVAASGASPMLATGGAALPPCGPSGSAANTVNTVAGAANSVGGQRAANATSTATNTASNAIAQFSGLKSLFGKKNAAAPAPTANLSGSTPCVPVATGGSTAVAGATPTAPAAASPAVGAAPGVAAAPTAATGMTAAGKAPAATGAVSGRAAATASRSASATATSGAANATAKPTAAKPAAIANSVVPAARTTNAGAKKPAATTAAKPAPATPASTPTK
jgi:hypothetical protein